MTDGRCPSCGKTLPARAGGRGRVSKYCSPACRQKAYRERQQPAAGAAVPDLIADIEQRVRRLAPQLPEAFYTDVTDLASTVGKLRRIAQLARDAAVTENVTLARVTEDHPENVTPAAVTEENVTDDAVTETREGENDEVTAAVRAGDEWDFAGLVEPFRHELQVHCYRMVGSYDDAEDMVQETFLRAWNRRDAFEGRSTFRAWLYRIATNSCLDFLRRNQRRPQRYEPVPGMDSGTAEPPARVTWLQPYPDALLEDVASTDVEPERAAVSRETMELVFLAAIQHLPPRQRAVLIMRDVLGWPAADTAEQLDMTVASVNSALQRARPALRRHLPERRGDWTMPARPTSEEREILQRYMDAADQADAAVVAELLSEDVVLTMPPNPFWFVGRDAMMAFIKPSIDPASPHFQGTWKHLPTFANRMPAAAGYLRRPGTTVYRAQVLDVLRIEGGRIVEITSFEPHLFPAFGLPLTL